jgi:hypothetical protein
MKISIFSSKKVVLRTKNKKLSLKIFQSFVIVPLTKYGENLSVSSIHSSLFVEQKSIQHYFPDKELKIFQERIQYFTVIFEFALIEFFKIYFRS